MPDPCGERRGQESKADGGDAENMRQPPVSWISVYSQETYWGRKVEDSLQSRPETGIIARIRSPKPLGIWILSGE